MITYRTLSISLCALFFVLGAILLLAPETVYWIFGVTSHASADVLSRRAGVLFFGLFTISFLGRSAPHSLLRQAYLVGICVIMFGLIFTGLFEFIFSNVGPGIWLAIITEAVLGVFSALIWFRREAA